jgi:hypothetical protein
MKGIFRKGYKYKRAGVIVMDIIAADELQGSLFDENSALREKEDKISEIMDSVNELRMVKSQLDELTKQKKSCEDAIKTYMADADTLCLAGTKDKNPSVIATWKTAKDSLKFNEKLFASEHADLYNQYMTNVTGSRRFLVK